MPFYRRKWFLIGLGLLAIGFFTYVISWVKIEKIGAEYPQIVTEEEGGGASSETRGAVVQSEAEEMARARMVYRKYVQSRDYFSLVFGILGVILILFSFKEPQVPMLKEENGEGKELES